MASFYGKMQGVSKKLIDKFGNPFVLKKPDGKSYYDPELDEMVSPWKEFSGYGLMSSITAEVIGLQDNIINAGDVSFVCYLDDKTIVPTEADDKFVFAGTEYNILNVDTVAPNGVDVILHILFARKSS